MSSSVKENISDHVSTPIAMQKSSATPGTSDTKFQSDGCQIETTRRSDSGYPQGLFKRKESQIFRPKDGKFHKCTSGYIFWIDFGIFLAVCGFITIILICIGKPMKSYLLSSGVTEHPAASTNTFSQFSVASSSEHCDEFARQWMIEGEGTDEIAIMMILCLTHFDPQSSPIFGESTLLYTKINTSTNEPECWQSTAGRGVSLQLREFIDNAKITERSAHNGYLSMTIPGDIRTGLALAETLGENWEERLNYISTKFAVMVANTKVPASIDLIKALNHRYLELQLKTKSSLKSLANEVKHEGDTFENNYTPTWISHIINLKTFENNAQKLEKDIEKSFTEMLTSDIEKFKEQWRNNIRDISFQFKKKIVPWTMIDEKKKEVYNYSFCATSHIDWTTREELRPLIVEGLKFAHKTHMESFERVMGNVPKKYFHHNAFPYHIVKNSTEKVYKLIREFGKKKMYKRTEKEKELYKELAKLKRERKVPVGVNGFVLVNHIEKEAYVYGGTIGTSFGSLIPNDGNKFLNNLKSLIGMDYDRLADTHFHQEPVVVTKKRGNGTTTIELAYMDLNDFDHPATNIVRKINVFYLKFLNNFDLSKVLGWPLYYKNVKNIYQISKNIPLKRRNEVAELVTKSIKEQVYDLIERDVVLAVDKRATINFSKDDTVRGKWRVGLGL